MRVDVIDDSDDDQSLHSHHVPTLVSEDLPNKVHHPAAVSRLVHLVPYHGELWVGKKIKLILNLKKTRKFYIENRLK